MSEKQVEELIDKAAKAGQPHEAMSFAQAALNAAHAMQVLATIKRNSK